MDCLYDFQCDRCQHTFEDFVSSESVNAWGKKKELVVSCQKCGENSHLLFVQLAQHGHNHSSWAVKMPPKEVKKKKKTK